MDAKLVAPCGMNCAVCKGYLRLKNSCPGCNFVDKKIPVTRLNCRIRLCQKRTGKFCFGCRSFPCARLKHLDKRYRAKYGLSEIENLQCIRDCGMEKFLEEEMRKWIKPGGMLCCHDGKIYKPISRKMV